MQSEIPTPSKVVAYLLASCTPEQRTGLPPTCTSSWLQRHKPVCALWFVLKSAFWFMFYHHCRLFQVFSFVLAHQSRHHEDQMQMCQMKSSSKRSRVKTCSVSISLSFSWAPHCHTCDYTTVLQQPLWIKHCTNHSVSSSFGDLTLNPFFFFFFAQAPKRWQYKTAIGILCFGTKFNCFWWGKLSQMLSIPAEGREMGQVATPPKALQSPGGSISKGLWEGPTEPHPKSPGLIPSTGTFCSLFHPTLHVTAFFKIPQYLFVIWKHHFWLAFSFSCSLISKGLLTENLFSPLPLHFC